MVVAITTTPDLTTAKPPRSRCWIPLSLRMFVAILALLLIGSVLSVWLPWHREQQVIQLVESWGGVVDTQSGGPEWLRRLMGKDRIKGIRIFERVNQVALSNPAITDTDVIQLNGLTNLRRLHLSTTAVTDAGLAHLSKLTTLTRLSLSGTAVTDKGLAHLSSLTNLELLALNVTAVTDAGMAHLCGLRNLKDLSLDGTAVTDVGLAELSGCTKLEFLFLDRTAVTDEGIEELKKALPACKIYR